jgi:pimeloyl-ACP methyl ester carboxylesterase
VEQLFDALPGIQSTYAGLRYPFDEYHAFGVGPPLAKYLTALRAQRGDRSINVLAHSLGNLAVNSALYKINEPGVVDKYVMNEAAFAAEALDLAYSPTEDELTLYGDKHAATYGHPDDVTWTQEWAFNAQNGVPPNWQDKLNKMRDQGASLNISAQEMYTRRWLQIRPFPVLDNDQSSTSRRGPWNAYFGRNRTFTRMFNTYSENDRVVGMLWRTNQRILKPFAGVIGPLADKLIRDAVNKAIREYIAERLGLVESEGEAAMKTKDLMERIIPQVPELQTHDNLSMLTWELTKWTEPSQATVFGGEDKLHWTMLRQWAELSFWFPSTSIGAGVKNLDSVLGAHCNIDVCVTNFTKYSGLGDGPAPAEFSDPIRDAVKYGGLFGYTHSYLGYGKFTDVWKAYGEIAKIFDPKN